MKELGTALDIPIHVYGPETHMTAIVGMAMGKREIVDPAEMMTNEDTGGQNFSLPTMVNFCSYIIYTLRHKVHLKCHRNITPFIDAHYRKVTLYYFSINIT